MGYRLGVDLGTTFTAAAVYDGGPPSMLGLGNRALQIPSVLFLTENGTFLVGDAAERKGLVVPSRVVREFKRRIGDPVPVLVAGSPFSPEHLTARLLSEVLATATERMGAPPDEIVLTHPANWGAYKRDLLNQVISMAGAGPTRTCPEPEAAAIQYAARAGLAPGAKVVVYDLGGGTFDVCVLEKTSTGFTLLGSPDGVEHLGGADFDEAVFQHVLTALGPAVTELDATNSEAKAALARLRRDCVDAKEALSADVDAIVPVTLPGYTTSIRLTRSELEQIIGPSLANTVDATRRALHTAGLGSEQLTAIVLIGGSSRIPLVSHLLQSNFGTPTALDTHPKHDVALGAARLEQPVIPVEEWQPPPDPPRLQVPPATPVQAPPEPPVAPPQPADEPATARPQARPRTTPARSPRTSRRSLVYGLAAAVLAVLGLLVASVGPESPVTNELRWNSADGWTTGAKAPRGARMTPTILGFGLPGDPVAAERGEFQIGRGYRLFLAGPAVATFTPPAAPRRLVRSGGAWWSPIATVPGVAMIVGLLFAIAYAESLLRVLRKRHSAVRAGELLGMAGVGAVLGVVVVVAAWMLGSLPTAGAVGFVIAALTASLGLLGVAVAGRDAR
ncbi:MAG: Hsp70 family protein [Kribbellaceae bacterium]